MRGRIQMVRHGLTSWVGHRLASPRCAIDPSTSQIALTFDDGPDPVFTNAILDVLEGFQVPATFFLIGERAQRHPSVVLRMTEAGHSIGSHTKSHPDMWTLTPREVLRQYIDGQAMVEDVAGREVRLVRPPKGWLGAVSGGVLRSGRFSPVLWSSTGDDWKVGATVESILGAIGVAAAGDIVLLHDAIERPEDPSVNDRTQTVHALEHIIERAKADGLNFTALEPDRPPLRADVRREDP